MALFEAKTCRACGRKLGGVSSWRAHGLLPCLPGQEEEDPDKVWRGQAGGAGVCGAAAGSQLAEEV